jgi:hypothetical protein
VFDKGVMRQGRRPSSQVPLRLTNPHGSVTSLSPPQRGATRGGLFHTG